MTDKSVLRNRRAAAGSAVVRTVESVTLTNEERDRLHDNYVHLAFPERIDADHDGFVSASTAWFYANAPQQLVDTIVRWKSDPRSAGVLIVDNIGVDRTLPETPTDGRRSPDKLTSYSEMVLTAVGSLLGEVFSFRNEREGQLVTDLTPVLGKEQDLTNEGANQLGWHTEHAATGLTFDPPMTVISYLAFLGLRSDHDGQARTLVADLRDALRLLGPEDERVLRSKSFRVRPPVLVRQTLPAEKQSVEPVSVITGPPELPEIRVAMYGDLSEALSTDAERALRSLRKALDLVHRGFRTKPGRLMVVNNRVALHARAPFRPRYDGQDRWLQRIMVTDSLWPLRPWQKNSKRILEP